MFLVILRNIIFLVLFACTICLPNLGELVISSLKIGIHNLAVAIAGSIQRADSLLLIKMTWSDPRIDQYCTHGRMTFNYSLLVALVYKLCGVF